MSEDRVITIEVHARTKDGKVIASESFLDGGTETEIRESITGCGMDLVDDLKKRGLL